MSSSPVFGGVCVAHHYIFVCYSIVCLYCLCSCQRISNGQSKTDNQEKLAIQGTQDEEIQNKNTQHANKHKQRNALIQTTVAIDHPNIISMRKSRRTSQHGTQNVKTHNRITHKNIMISNTDPTKNRGRTHLCYHFSLIVRFWLPIWYSLTFICRWENNVL
jgi:hypothetical protein